MLLIGIGCAALQLLAAAWVASDGHDGLSGSAALLSLAWFAVPAAITLAWAWSVREASYVHPRLPALWAGVTALQVVVYLGLGAGSMVTSTLPTVLIVALVFLWAVWRGRP